MIYFFAIGTKPSLAFNVNLEGLIPENVANGQHYQKMAEHHAKFLNEISTEPVRFYPKGREDSAVVIEAYDETENSKGGSEPGNGQENHIKKIS